MYCNRCNKNIDITYFSTYLLNNKNIYYLNCNNCRNKINTDDKKNKEKEEYLNRKNNNVVECECGVKYISFREYHKYRHSISKKHQEYIKKNNKIII